MKRLFLILCASLVLTVSCFAADVTLQWDANTESDLAGYKVYYGTESRVYSEPIILGLVTTYTMHIPDSVMYFFAVTAFDTGELESDYSNEVSCMNNAKPGAVINIYINCN
jgi:fibronectin type 3 domain-containing protein